MSKYTVTLTGWGHVSVLPRIEASTPEEAVSKAMAQNGVTVEVKESASARS